MEHNDALQKLMAATQRVMARGRWADLEPEKKLALSLTDGAFGQRLELERLARLDSMKPALGAGC